VAGIAAAAESAAAVAAVKATAVKATAMITAVPVAGAPPCRIAGPQARRNVRPTCGRPRVTRRVVLSTQGGQAASVGCLQLLLLPFPGRTQRVTSQRRSGWSAAHDVRV